MFPDVQVNMIRVVADFVAESLKANKDQRKKNHTFYNTVSPKKPY